MAQRKFDQETAANADTRITRCPECKGELNASVNFRLYAVSIDQHGSIVDYDGGPQPDSEEDILELAASDTPTIYCAEGHFFTLAAAGLTPAPRPAPAAVLQRIATWPANSNSNPDVMGEALDEIQSLAAETASLLITQR